MERTPFSSTSPKKYSKKPSTIPFICKVRSLSKKKLKYLSNIRSATAGTPSSLIALYKEAPSSSTDAISPHPQELLTISCESTNS
jgi:hypothetical protein